jgi:hypothetical protein
MRFWNGECSRAFTDWRGLQYGAGDGAWLIEETRMYPPVAGPLSI